MSRNCLVALVLPLLAPHISLHAAEGAKPNIVIIFIDDLGYADIGPFGATKQKTPNLDRMAVEGMKLTSFYAAPVCSVSRAQLLTRAADLTSHGPEHDRRILAAAEAASSAGAVGLALELLGRLDEDRLREAFPPLQFLRERVDILFRQLVRGVDSGR